MKLQNLGLALFAVAAFQTAAMAEMISGTISSIDPQAKTLTLVRLDNQKAVTVSVNNESELSGLQPGGQVTVDAGRGLFGGWKANNVISAEAGASAGNENRPNANQNAIPGSERTSNTGALGSGGMSGSESGSNAGVSANAGVAI